MSMRGEANAFTYFDLQISKPTYPSTEKERDEASEVWRRQLVAKEKEALKTEGGPWGLYVVAEGKEEDFVQGKLQAYHSRWQTVKSVMDPDVEGDDISSFKGARRRQWREICLSIHKELGWRWKRSPTLVGYMEETLDKLANAPTKTYGQDTVLDSTGMMTTPCTCQQIMSNRSIGSTTTKTGSEKTAMNYRGTLNSGILG